MSNDTRQLVVIGAGPGGYAAAFLAADLGMKVTLVDPEENPGGVCLYRGCIPTKALLHAVEFKADAEEADYMGLSFKNIDLDTEKLLKWKGDVVKQLTGGLGQLVKARKIEYIRGQAVFSGSKSINIKRLDGKEEEMDFEQAIIATGSHPFILPGTPENSERIFSSEAGLDIPFVPERMLVVGAGYIGLEMSTVYHGLGTKISIVEMLDGLMPGADRDLIKEFSKASGGLFEEIILNTKVTNIEEKNDKLEVSFEGEKESGSYDAVMMTVGRKPNSGELNLDTAGIETDEKGFITVDEERRTSNQAVFAVGDITGPPLLAHKANREGRVAAEVAAGKKSAYEPATVPSVEYTRPEIAWAGITEEEAKAEGRRFKVSRFPWKASGRAATIGTNKGLTKLIIEEETERIIGVGIVGKNAGELIPEGTLAIEMAALASDLELTIHPHPTLSETLMEAAAAFYGTPTTMYKPKRKS